MGGLEVMAPGAPFSAHSPEQLWTPKSSYIPHFPRSARAETWPAQAGPCVTLCESHCALHAVTAYLGGAPPPSLRGPGLSSPSDMSSSSSRETEVLGCSGLEGSESRGGTAG